MRIVICDHCEKTVTKTPSEAEQETRAGFISIFIRPRRIKQMEEEDESGLEIDLCVSCFARYSYFLGNVYHFKGLLKKHDKYVDLEKKGKV